MFGPDRAVLQPSEALHKKAVLISDYFEYYRLAAYIAWRTKERIGIVLGAANQGEFSSGAALAKMTLDKLDDKKRKTA